MIDKHIYEVEVGERYISKCSKTLVEVLGFCKHAQDCSNTLIRFYNINNTVDTKAGTEWVLDELIFIKRFNNL